MHFTTRSFIGRPDDVSWSQYWENEPDDPTLTSLRGHLFALVNLQIEEGSASDIGHLLINEINQTYFSSTEVASPVWLRRTLETIVQNPVYKTSLISLMVAVVLDGNLHLCFLNIGMGIFKRGPKISQIISGIDGQVTEISGKLAAGDQFLLCTTSFLNSYGWDKIKSVLSGPSISDIEENFLIDLNTFTDQSLLAGLLVQIHEETIEADFPVADEKVDAPIEVPQNKPKTSIFKSMFKPRPTYVSHLETDSVNKRKKINIIIGVIVLLAIFVSVYFGAKQNKIQQIESNYQTLKQTYQSKINNALAIKNINLEESQKEASSSKKIVEQMALLKIHPDEVSIFMEQTNSLLSQTGSADAYKPTPFYDTSLIGGQAHYTQMYLAKNKLYLLDNAAGRIDSVDTNNRSLDKVLPSGISSGIESIAENSGNLYVLKNKSIYLLSNKNLESKLDISSSISDFSRGSIHFWNGALYILAQLTDNNSAIWKFAPNSTGFGSGSNWLKDSKPLPVPATSFAINGQVWTLSQNGQVIPYARGVAGTYKSATSLTIAKNLVTSVDSEVLALTDKDSLVYVYHKNSPQASSYNFDKKKILSLALNGQDNIIYVLCDDQVIYQIKL